MQTFEYKVAEFNLYNLSNGDRYSIDKLNSLGAQGWEITNVFKSTLDHWAYFIFRRPLESVSDNIVR